MPALLSKLSSFCALGLQGCAAAAAHAEVGVCKTDEAGVSGACADHLLLQLAPAASALRVAGPHPYSAEEPPACHTSEEGEECHKHVDWAMYVGFPQDSGNYPGLSSGSTSVDFQAWMHKRGEHGCPEPCVSQACHTAREGEKCHKHATWAMEVNFPKHPSEYPGLTSESTILDFQTFLYEHGMHSCKPPCLEEQLPSEGGRRQRRTPKRFETVEQEGARITVGGTIRLYAVGTSNVAWQTWPDRLHALLADLGYVLPPQNFTLATSKHPTAMAPLCDDASEYEHLETPRIAKPGWGSWGFAYDSKAGCQPAAFEGELGEQGFRSIAGHQVSCVNAWACSLAGRNAIVKPSEVAEDTREADVVLLSNWMNDSKQRYAQHRCFKGEPVEVVDTAAITLASLRRLIQAIHSVNPKAVVLVMARYPNAAGPWAIEGGGVDKLNRRVKLAIEKEPNTFFVNYSFPTGQQVFQTRNPGHPNCRGDLVMATEAVRVLYQRGVLARGLALPGSEEAKSCLGAAECGAIKSKACCQQSALCRVDGEGACVPLGPGIQ